GGAGLGGPRLRPGTAGVGLGRAPDRSGGVDVRHAPSIGVEPRPRTVADGPDGLSRRTRPRCGTAAGLGPELGLPGGAAVGNVQRPADRPGRPRPAGDRSARHRLDRNGGRSAPARGRRLGGPATGGRLDRLTAADAGSPRGILGCPVRVESLRQRRPRKLLRERCTERLDRKSTRLNSSHVSISYAVFCLKKKNITYY